MPGIFNDTLTQEIARLFVEAGHLSMSYYIELVWERGWNPGPQFSDSPDGRPWPRPTRGMMD